MNKHDFTERFFVNSKVIFFGATRVSGGETPTYAWQFDVLQDEEVVDQEIVQLSVKDLGLIRGRGFDEQLLVSMKFAHGYRYRDAIQKGVGVPSFDYRKLFESTNAEKAVVRCCLLETIHGFYEEGIQAATLFGILLSCDFSREEVKQAIDWCERREWLLQRGPPYPERRCAYELNPSKIIEIENFLKSPPRIRPLHRHFQEVPIDVSGDFAFVIMPFREEEFPQRIYSDVIKPFVDEKFKIRCVRVDEDFTSQNILNKIYTYTLRSDFVIAEISTRNPNVMYELGLALSLGKDVIVVENKEYASLSKWPERIFHIDKFPYYRYEDDSELREELDRAIIAHLKLQKQ